jgi:hypothetical protein
MLITQFTDIHPSDSFRGVGSHIHMYLPWWWTLRIFCFGILSYARLPELRMNWAYHLSCTAAHLEPVPVIGYIYRSQHNGPLFKQNHFAMPLCAPTPTPVSVWIEYNLLCISICCNVLMIEIHNCSRQEVTVHNVYFKMIKPCLKGQNFEVVSLWGHRTEYSVRVLVRAFQRTGPACHGHPQHVWNF